MPGMNRRQFLQTAASAAVAAPFIGCGRTRRPNVVFVLSDDLRWDCMGVAGHPFLKTPNIDRLANEGIRFSNAFCTSSLCSPSRASFLSGLYAHSHQVINNFTEFPSTIPSYPQRLHDDGYNTAYIGKWHMGEGNDEKRPGFDYWASHKGQGQYYDTPFNVDGQRQVIKGYYAHVVTNLATEWLKTARRPFSLTVGHKAPHGLWIPEPKYAHAFDNVAIRKPETAVPGPGTPDWVSRRIKTWHGIDGPLYGSKDFDTFIRTYHETILSVDDSVGQIYEALRAMGELDNTIFLFAGDNGFLLGEHASIDKRTMWEESIRIPLLVRYPDAMRDHASSIGWSSTWMSHRACWTCAAPPRSRQCTALRSRASARGRRWHGGIPGCTNTTSKRSSRIPPTYAACEPTNGATCTIRMARGNPTRRRRSSTTSRPIRSRSTI